MTSKVAESATRTVPNRTLVRALIAVGWLLIVGSLCLVGYMVWNDFLFTHYNPYTGEAHHTGIRWYEWLFTLVGGATLAMFGHAWYAYYFTYVESGTIVGMDTSGGGERPLSWDICIEGKTLAGETYTNWLSVSAGLWRDLKIGQHYTRKR